MDVPPSPPGGRPALHINSLPHDCLQRIFARVGQFERKDCLPLVCKLWSRQLAGPCYAWRQLCLDASWMDNVDRLRMLAWIAKRCAGVETLIVNAEGVTGSWPLDLHPLMAAALPNLTMLGMMGQTQPLPWGVTQLTALQELILDGPDNLPPGISALTALTKLWLELPCAGQDLAPIVALTRLQDLLLDWSEAEEPEGLVQLPAGLAQLGASLQSFCLHGSGMHSVDVGSLGAISSLTRLTELALQDCRLTEAPPCLAALPQLKQLRISGNCFPGVPQVVSALTALTWLSCDPRGGPPGLPEQEGAGFAVPEWITTLQALSVIRVHGYFVAPVGGATIQEYSTLLDIVLPSGARVGLQADWARDAGPPTDGLLTFSFRGWSSTSLSVAGGLPARSMHVHARDALRVAAFLESRFGSGFIRAGP